MAQKAIKEFDAKRLLFDRFKGVLVGPETDVDGLVARNSWLVKDRLVIKPDEVVGKRGKHGLVGVDLNWDGVKEYLKRWRNREVEISGVKDTLEYFLIEPYVEHKAEWFVAIRTGPEGDEVLWSDKGGIEVERSKAKSMIIPVGTEFTGKWPVPFIEELYKKMVGLDFTSVEINPLAKVGDRFVPLDVKARLDDAARFFHLRDWGDIEWPTPWGRRKLAEEEVIESLDEKSGASLKLTVLNPKGKLWLLLAGGGGSIVYTDAAAELGQGKELANYGEYSGNPSAEEMYQYTKAVVGVMLREGKAIKEKKLLIVGAVANFTDVAVTFRGIIRALREVAADLKKQGVEILVRRGGPNYEEGLVMMRRLGEELGIKVQAFGPELPMTQIVEMALRLPRLLSGQVRSG